MFIIMSTQRSELGSPSPSNQVEFGQEELADFIVEEINQDPNIQIAINGPWGSGKTTILEETYEKIGENSSAITVWYEPWRYSPDQTTLRRTFLKKVYERVATEIESAEPIEDEKFHFTNVKQESKDLSNFLKDFWRTIQDQVKLISVFVLSVGLLLSVGFVFSIINLGVIGSLIGYITQLIAFVLVISLMFYLRDDLVSGLAEDLTFDVREPKISEIDLFEEKYDQLLSKIGEEDKRLVVFVDDLDRCSSDEMREVITGLSTYLDPNSDQTPVSIVTAIDGPKIVDSFDGDIDEDDNQIRPNILNKTFQIVLPVPSLSRSDVSELIQNTASDLDYQISEANITRISRIAVSHADSNLRIIRSALSDLMWMKKISGSYLSIEGFGESGSFNKIINDDYVLFRISLIKLLSRNEDLRRFVTDASMWIDQSEREGEVLWELFDISPRFNPSELDPRPLLGLNNPNEYSANIKNFDEIQKQVTGRSDPGDPIPLIEKYGPAAQVDIGYRLSDENMENYERNDKMSYVDTVIHILNYSLSAVDSNSSDLFSDCYQIVKNDRGMISDIRQEDYLKWLTIAEKINDGNLKKLFQKSSPFILEDKNQFLSAISNSASNFDRKTIEELIDVELREVENGNEVRSARRVATIFKAVETTGVDNAAGFLLKLLGNWSFDNNPEGPPKDVMNSKVIEKLHSDKHIEEAKTVFTKVGSRGDAASDYLEVLMNSDWPRPTDLGENEE